MKAAVFFDALLLGNKRRQLARKSVLKKFADKIGLVYFGYVDQHSDEHRVVRGFTTSATHKDDSYILGEYEGYSVALVDRFDAFSDGRRVEKHSWLVLDVTLHEDMELPHTFLLPIHQKSVHYSKIFTAFSSLEKVDIKADVPDFHRRYEIFSRPDQHGLVEELLTIDIIRTIAAHFWPVAIEMSGSSVYFYYADTKLSEQALNSVMKNSVWLSQTLEKSLQVD